MPSMILKMNIELTTDVDVISASLDRQLVGGAKISSWRETTGIEVFLINIDVDEKYHGLGITQALLDEAEKISRSKMSKESGYTPLYGTNCDNDQPGFRNFLEENGYCEIFSVVDMELNLENFSDVEKDIPYSIERLLPHQVEEVFHLMMNSYLDREFIVEMEIGDEDTTEFLENLVDEDTFCFVAKNGKSIIGFVWVRNKDNKPYIGQLSVDPAHLRRGIARALMTRALHELKILGETLVWLDTSGEDVSGARSLYNSLGFSVVKTYHRFRKPM